MIWFSSLMNFLKPIFKAVAKLPVELPDEGYRAKLLVCGALPFTCTVSVGYDLSDQRRFFSVKEEREFKTDKSILDTAVKDGKLLQYSHFTAGPGGSPKVRLDYHYQPSAKQLVLADAQAQSDGFSKWHGELTAEQKKGRDAYFAFQELPLPVRVFAKAVAPLTRYARFQVAKQDAAAPRP